MFYMFAFDTELDPTACWVKKGQLWVSQSPTGSVDEIDVGAIWRTFYICAFIIHICFGLFATFAGVFICSDEKSIVKVGKVSYFFAIVALLAKIALFWWAVILRATQEGSVAAGKMIDECKLAHLHEMTGVTETNEETGSSI